MKGQPIRRAVIYARYSSDRPGEASIEDQQRLYGDLAARLGHRGGGRVPRSNGECASTRRTGYHDESETSGSIQS
jgi:hypothetical protein